MEASEIVTGSNNALEDEEDYMNMIITEPNRPKGKETYTHRRIRKQREAEIRGRVKSKAELEADEAVARESALSTSLLADPSKAAANKGFAMMTKMGFKPGLPLGRQDGAVDARTEPVGVRMKEDRGGIGMDTERKRKFREEYEKQGKRVKAEEVEYRDRIRREREDARLEVLVGSAMRVAERMTGEREEELNSRAGKDEEAQGKRTISTKPLKQINVLWRGLVRSREEKERSRRMRHDLQQSLSRLPSYYDPDEDIEDRRALGRDLVSYTLVEDLEEEDPELDEFNALDPVERLRKLVIYLREEYNYCFWCKFTYLDEEMDGCPGLSEEDHD